MYIRKINKSYLKIDTSQMVEVDRLMMEHYSISLIQMMENAGRCLAIVAREEYLSGDVENKRICVLAGTGGNGGGAMVGARRLSAWGAKVKLFTTAAEESMTPVPRHQYKILKRIGIEMGLVDDLDNEKPYDLIIDGIIGYSVKGDPYGTAKQMIDWTNKQYTKVLSLDTPSGLDLTSGKAHNPIINADGTLTLAMVKQGLFSQAAKSKVGQLYLGDISVPPQLYSQPSLGLRAQNVFRFSDIVKIVNE